MASMEKMEKINVVAPLYTEAAALADVADALKLPAEDARQPDLQYLTAIFVSSGMNKNGAVFLGSELIKARNTITSKAVDLEHDEQRVVGQITGSVFLTHDRKPLDVEKAATSMPPEEMDSMEMDVGISAIIHKARFPELAQEISDGKWMVSMEAYYRDFDVKVGDMIVPREKAESLGFDKMIGSVVRLKDGNKELGFHLVGRVLRDILFAGVGVVKNPANPRSIIMESAAMSEYVEAKVKEGDVRVINLADIKEFDKSAGNNSKKIAASDDMADFIRSSVFEAVSEALKEANKEVSGEDTQEINQKVNKEEARDFLNHILPGTCVNYKRYVYAYPDDQLEDPETDLTQYPLHVQPGPVGTVFPGVEVSREHWCNLFDLECTSRPGDASHPDCWRNVFARTMKEEIDSFTELLRRRRISEGLVELQDLINEARKFEQ